MEFYFVILINYFEITLQFIEFLLLLFFLPLCHPHPNHVQFITLTCGEMILSESTLLLTLPVVRLSIREIEMLNMKENFLSERTVMTEMEFWSSD